MRRLSCERIPRALDVRSHSQSRVDWEGFGVYEFDVAKRSVVTLVSTNDVSDIIDREGDAKYRRQGPATAVFSNYVMVPSTTRKIVT